ncbi:DUF952 domain-containing protein [Scytonema hofmannii FACHB-248]|uniref:DUF952 domain-containing protein n=1 Tax=Scytonema hofmannii FACHB-248 TaxID=1842502 RepID=A0ABR8GIY1_9CYAN|nr:MULTISPECIES: DUF952 domain-containing protein [Nostocales]MBD2603134.1 DUF952 domain-containing protein [Scytonema hofmannii FACHB-248]
MTLILHITRREEWEKAKLAGFYRGDTLDSEGFIHCSTLTQVIKVANFRFRNERDLVILCIDSENVEAEIRYEGVEDLFPHVYGALNVDAVLKVVEFAPGEDGFFKLPLEVVDLV